MKTFRTLDLAVEFYDAVLAVEVVGNLKDQLHRAASSIALNLSEGNAKGSAKEKSYFFQTAYGSLRECQTLFRLIKVTDTRLLVLSDRLGANLYKLVNSEIKASPFHRK